MDPSQSNKTHPPQLATQLAAELLARHSLPVSPQWLAAFLSGVKTPAPPLPVLTSTAHFRLLNSDIRSCLTTSSITTSHPHSSAGEQIPLLTPQISDPNIKIRHLDVNVPVQILTVHDIGTSKWNQIEAIERIERGEEIRGREVIRNIPIMDEFSSTSANANNNSSTNSTTHTNTSRSTNTVMVKKSNGPHQLTLQDAAGTLVNAFEQTSLPKLFMTNTQEEGGVSIGCKLILKKGCIVRRGMVMLRPEDVLWLGGKVDEWDQVWRKGRKERLLKEIAELEGGGLGESHELGEVED